MRWNDGGVRKARGEFAFIFLNFGTVVHHSGYRGHSQWTAIGEAQATMAIDFNIPKIRSCRHVVRLFSALSTSYGGCQLDFLLHVRCLSCGGRRSR